MTLSTKEIVACSLAFSLAAFLITFAIYQDMPWLYIIDWILIGLYGLFYLLVKSEYKKNLVGDSWDRKYYKPLNNHIKSQIGQYDPNMSHPDILDGSNGKGAQG